LIAVQQGEDVMRTRPSRLALLLALAAVSDARAIEPGNMQQASPIPLVPDGHALATKFTRLDPSLDHIVAANSKVMVVKGENYFGVLEGGTWVPEGKSGYLLFSDFPANVIYKWAPDAGQLSVFLTKSGYTGDMSEFTGHPIPMQYGAPIYVYDFGANGTERDPEGRIVLCAHGDRQIVRLEQDGTRTVLATGYRGTRFYHPNEMTIKSDGAIYITDAHPAAAKSQEASPNFGVFLIKDGGVSLVVTGQGHGVALSPDEKTLYVTTYGSQAIMRYDVQPDDTVTHGRVFVDMAGQKGAPNGMAVDREGNVYSGGPGGMWVMDPNGRHIGSLPLPAIPANAIFGGPDLKTLYIMDARNLLQVHLNVPGMLLPARLNGGGAAGK
jgi:gluconolactonase